VVFAELDRHGAKLSINCGADGIHLPDRRCRDALLHWSFASVIAMHGI